MNRGGLGLVDSPNRLLLPLEILENFSISPDGVLFGIYYPADPNTHIPWSPSSIKQDFVITPVPHEKWNRCARFLVRLKHRPDALRTVAEFFSTRKVAILHSEGTRSGHRYGTWSLHLVFEDIKPGYFNARKSYYTGTNRARADLEKAMLKHCSEVLFSDPTDADLRNPIESWPHTALAYFHAHGARSRTSDRPDAWRFEPFRLSCDHDGVLISDDKRFIDILTSLSPAHHTPYYPEVVYASMDTRYLTIRVGVIPPERIHRFMELSVRHSRSGGRDSCLGIFAALLQPLSPQYNIWRIFNYTQRHDRTGASGNIVLLVEDDTGSELHDPLDYVRRLRARIPGTVASEGVSVSISDVEITPVLPTIIQSRLNAQLLRRKDFTHDVFISFDFRDLLTARKIAEALERSGMKAYIAERVQSGDEFSEEIRKAIMMSREMCVLCTSVSLENIWVATEWGAAWALGRNIVPIKSGVEWNQLPERLSRRQGRDLSDLDLYVADVRKRRAEFILPSKLL